MRNHPASVLLAALLTAPAFAQATQPQPQQLLRMAFQVGKQQYYQQTMSMHMDIDAGGTQMQTKMDMRFTTSLKVTAVNDGKADIEYRFHRIAVKAEGPMQTDYDSDVEGSDPGPLAEVSDLIGQVIKAKMDDRGRVSDVHLPEGLASESMQALGMGGIENFIGQNIPALPDKPIAIGATWNTEIPMPAKTMPGAKMKSTNKLLEVEAGKATLAQQLEIDLGDAQLPGGAEMKFDKSAATLVIDLATGMLISSDMEMVMNMNSAGMKMTNTTSAKTHTIDPPPAKTKPAKAKDDGGK